ncbi:MAG: thiamine phosphate synthase [Blastocatellia bacterium]
MPHVVSFMALNLPRLYPITDTLISGLPHAEQVRRLAEGGATLIQLRDKHAAPRDFYAAARDAVQVARRLGVRVIINDRVDIAAAVGADGVHLGQDDLPPEKARALLGADRIVGFSTHTLEQALAANSAPVDYVAIGPAFRTVTKERPDPVVGLAAISEIRQGVSKPLVAIGGITLELARSVIEAGADSVAVISDLYSAGDVAARARMYFRLLENV